MVLSAYSYTASDDPPRLNRSHDGKYCIYAYSVAVSTAKKLLLTVSGAGTSPLHRQIVRPASGMAGVPATVDYYCS